MSNLAKITQPTGTRNTEDLLATLGELSCVLGHFPGGTHFLVGETVRVIEGDGLEKGRNSRVKRQRFCVCVGGCLFVCVNFFRERNIDV